MRELDRLKVIEAIIEGRLKPAAAAQRLRLTTRQVHRLVLRYREDGPAGLTSRRRGQNWSSATTLSWPRKRYDGSWSMPACGYRTSNGRPRSISHATGAPVAAN
ncbi:MULTISPECIES: helix-turn-helix domain-containing protein [Pseudomonas aeruginosa group]